MPLKSFNNFVCIQNLYKQKVLYICNRKLNKETTKSKINIMNEKEYIEHLMKQAEAIMAVEENRKWIDSPEKLAIAAAYRLFKDHNINPLNK